MSSSPVPSPRSNTALWWILGIVGGGIVVLILLGLTLTGLIIRHVNVNDTGKSVEIQTPVGEVKVNKGERRATGLPVYPGAVATGDNNASVEISANDSGVGIATEQYQTKDTLKKVQDWYQKRLGPEFHQETGRDKALGGERYRLNARDHDVAFVDDRGDGARVVALDNISNGTKILLVRVGKREVQ